MTTGEDRWRQERTGEDRCTRGRCSSVFLSLLYLTCLCLFPSHWFEYVGHLWHHHKFFLLMVISVAFRAQFFTRGWFDTSLSFSTNRWTFRFILCDQDPKSNHLQLQMTNAVMILNENNQTEHLSVSLTSFSVSSLQLCCFRKSVSCSNVSVFCPADCLSFCLASFCLCRRWNVVLMYWLTNLNKLWLLVSCF